MTTLQDFYAHIHKLDYPQSIWREYLACKIAYECACLVNAEADFWALENEDALIEQIMVHGAKLFIYTLLATQQFAYKLQSIEPRKSAPDTLAISLYAHQQANALKNGHPVDCHDLAYILALVLGYAEKLGIALEQILERVIQTLDNQGEI